ncbi:unnamed protein product, partial [Vitis vinifera]|uniref:Uncharacterized protein n=1 Tax=Vitis vinifera TaxID=29760 RepID=D7TG78_VITVI
MMGTAHNCMPIFSVVWELKNL